MRSSGLLLSALAVTAGSCAHLRELEEPKDCPLELFQDNQLGFGYSLATVAYALDDQPLKTWRRSGDFDPGSPEHSVFEGRFGVGARKFAAVATVIVRDPGGSRALTSIRLAHVEPLLLVRGRRLRLVFRLCPAQRPNPVRSVVTEVEASLMTLGAARAPYVRGTCSSFAPPAEPGDDE